MQVYTSSTPSVVYFDQLSGVRSTRKLVEIHNNWGNWNIYLCDVKDVTGSNVRDVIKERTLTLQVAQLKKTGDECKKRLSETMWDLDVASTDNACLKEVTFLEGIKVQDLPFLCCQHWCIFFIFSGYLNIRFFIVWYLDHPLLRFLVPCLMIWILARYSHRHCNTRPKLSCVLTTVWHQANVDDLNACYSTLKY